MFCFHPRLQKSCTTGTKNLLVSGGGANARLQVWSLTWELRQWGIGALRDITNRFLLCVLPHILSADNKKDSFGLRRLWSETLGKVDSTELLRQAVNRLWHVLDSGSQSSDGSELLSCHLLFYFDSLVFACVFLFFIPFLPVLVFPPFHLHLYKIVQVSLCLCQAVFSMCVIQGLSRSGH